MINLEYVESHVRIVTVGQVVRPNIPAVVEALFEAPINVPRWRVVHLGSCYSAEIDVPNTGNFYWRDGKFDQTVVGKRGWYPGEE